MSSLLFRFPFSSLLRRNCFRISDAANISSQICSTATMKYETLNVLRPKEFVVQVEMNRPEKRNAMNTHFWREITECFHFLSQDKECRVVVLTGAGPAFSAGIDLSNNESINFVDLVNKDIDVARKAMQLFHTVLSFQESFNVIEKCPRPVIAAIHGACVGAAVDMVSACDIRHCTKDAWFSIKEVDLGLTADLGTLQRFPKIIGNDSLARELAFTARKMYASEAKDAGFVSHLYDTREALVDGAVQLAMTIASKSPVAVQGSKISMVYSRDHSVEDGLNHARTWNQCMLQSEDVVKSVTSNITKEIPVFSKL